MDLAPVLIYQLLVISSRICFAISENVNASCIRKCCPEEFVFSSELKKCVQAKETSEIFYNEFCLVHFEKCDRVLVAIPGNDFATDENNTLMVSVDNRTVLLGREEYCLEYVNRVITAFMCVGESKKEVAITQTIREKSKAQDEKFAYAKSVNCITKCCSHNSVFSRSNGNTCIDKNQTVRLNPHNVCLETRINCENDTLIRIPLNLTTIQVKNYTLIYTFRKQSVLFAKDDFCLEVDDDSGTRFPFVCVPAPQKVAEKTAATGMIISMPFLLATFIVYALLPDRNLHMKALMIYVLSLMMAYLLLVIIQLSPNKFSNEKCTTIGYFCLFFFLISFFWMNVICIDIWLTFSGLRGFSGNKKSAERKRFLMYCAYAFGMPILHISVVKIIDVNASENSLFKPDIGTAQCFLKRGYPELFYFYGPMAIIITINIVLFTITAFKIRSIKKDTSMLKKEDSKRHSYENDKQTFNLYLKLLFAMGVNWSMEIISWAVIWAGKAPEWIWYLTDFCNAIYGVFIFFIFVFKRSIWKLLKKRYYSFTGKAHLAHSMTMTNTTRVTSYSTANSSIHENPHSGANDTSTLTGEA